MRLTRPCEEGSAGIDGELRGYSTEWKERHGFHASKMDRQ